MDFVAAVVADEQAFEVVEPGEGALDDPSDAAEACAVRCVAVGDHRGDPALAEQAAVLVVVVAAVAEHPRGAPAWSSSPSLDGRDAIEQRDQLGDIVAVAAGGRERERDPRAVDEEVMLGTGSAAVNRARARFGAPFFACTWLPSTTALSQSSSPAWCSLLSNSRCS